MTTDFARWASGLADTCAVAACEPGVCLMALTGEGRVLIAVGEDLEDLRRYPVDRLALVPSTFGGMIVTSTPEGARRVVCADGDGEVAVLEGLPGGRETSRRLEVGLPDHEVLALLWLLMDVQATRPAAPELAARVLTWGWLGSPVRAAVLAGSEGASDEGLDCLAAGDLPGLARLLGVTLPTPLDAEGLRALASLLGHPSLNWDALPWVVSEAQRLDFLHACLPTRWALADELRTCDGRDDLAELVMAAPTAMLPARPGS